ncbi:MAG: hypothetical protein DRG24_01555 [Epsilonproteobacteria bacterium]|nr:MAG: hypothetical protein DRG24_01555 [Campylobacterota bacterium]
MNHTVQVNKNWFTVYSIAFLFGIIWTMIGESDVRLVYITLSFILFLRAGVILEKSSIEAQGEH